MVFRRIRQLPALGYPIFVVAAVLAMAASASAAAPAPDVTHTGPPPIRHVFVINLENKGFAETFGPSSAAPYLSRQLRAKGNLLTQYYGTAHESLPNYIAQISGQGPDSQTQGDCQVYSDFTSTGTAPPEQAVGNGCVYPATVRTLPNQLAAKGLTWRGYLQDMSNDPAAARTCRHPAIGAVDNTQQARKGDQYAVRHNPFVYFHSIIDAPACARNDVPLGRLRHDLRAISSTPNYAMIVPNLCRDGHDSPCVNGQPGGLRSADGFLRYWVPKILASPAYQRDGLLIITFDESEGPQSDASACCNEGPGPNSPQPGITGPGGGRVGAVVLSRYVKAGSLNDTPYNHYALLGSIEDLFGLPHLGYAQQVPYRFGRDVYTNY